MLLASGTGWNDFAGDKHNCLQVTDEKNAQPLSGIRHGGVKLKRVLRYGGGVGKWCSDLCNEVVHGNRVKALLRAKPEKHECQEGKQQDVQQDDENDSGESNADGDEKAFDPVSNPCQKPGSGFLDEHEPCTGMGVISGYPAEEL